MMVDLVPLAEAVTDPHTQPEPKGRRRARTAGGLSGRLHRASLATTAAQAPSSDAGDLTPGEHTSTRASPGPADLLIPPAEKGEVLAHAASAPPEGHGAESPHGALFSHFYLVSLRFLLLPLRIGGTFGEKTQLVFLRFPSRWSSSSVCKMAEQGTLGRAHR